MFDRQNQCRYTDGIFEEEARLICCLMIKIS